MVWDRALFRISVLAPSGEFVRSLRLESTEGVTFAIVNAVYDDGSFLASGSVNRPGRMIAGRHSYPSPAYHFGRDGAFLNEAGLYPTEELYLELLDGGGLGILTPLFTQTVQRLAVGTRFLFTSSARYELRFMTQDGVLGPVNTKGRFVLYWGYENHRVPISADRGLLSTSARQCEHLQSRSA